VVAAVLHTRLGREAEHVGSDAHPHLRWRPTDTDRVLLLTHFDTVWPIGTLERFPFEVAGTVVRGPGVFDMKAGIVIAVHALALVRDIHGDDAIAGVTLLATSDEETGSAHSRPLVEEHARTAAAVLVFEGSGPGGELKTARKGVGGYRLTSTGRAAHAGLEPETGANALLSVATFATAAAELADAPAGTTVTPTVLNAGRSRNTVPDSAELLLDVRAATLSEQERVDRGLRALAARPDPYGCSLELRGGPHRPPMTRETSNEIFALAADVADRIGHRPLAEMVVGGGSDGSFTAALGIPTLDGLGAVGGGAHAATEHIVLDELAERIALTAALIERLLHEEES